jgi:hypothetical protein
MARVTTLQLLLAWSTAAGVRNATLDWWVELCDATWAEQRLVRDPLAWLAEAKVAEIRALMLATWEHLFALYGAKMKACWVSGPAAKLFLYRAADFLA